MSALARVQCPVCEGQSAGCYLCDSSGSVTADDAFRYTSKEKVWRRSGDLPIAIVSVSGGKDSGATAQLAIDRYGRDRVRLVHADTGHEHELTVDFVRETLPAALGLPLHIVKADFSADIARKRVYVRDKWPEKLTRGAPGKWVLLGAHEGEPAAPPTPEDIYSGQTAGPFVWSAARRPVSADEAAEIVERALVALVPTDVPFLDLCIWKGRFPSRKAQFCTQFLKRYPLDAHMLGLMSQGLTVESWQGIRRDEGQQRRDALERELSAEGWWIERPIVAWTADEVIQFHHDRGIPLNPLYSLGCSRVGCMLCINAGKDEIANCSQRFPQHIERIEQMEWLVGQASKRGFSTLLHHADGEGGDSAHAFAASNIREMVRWSMTSRGGRQFDMLRMAEPAACSSSYGLCE